MTAVALSLRQPWAGLLIGGPKRIEIRTWRTHHRGWVGIHASKVIDRRAEAWRWVTPELRPLCELRGGLIGVANLIECLVYPSAETFAADLTSHLNATGWFRPPRMYGFRFCEPRLVPFQSCLGNTGFFRVATEWPLPGFESGSAP